MPKPTCEMLVTPLEALAAHDAAHACADRKLHGLALRLMSLCDLDHLGVASDLDDEGATAESPLRVYRDWSEVPEELASSGLYDVCLLRRTHRSAVEAGAMLPNMMLYFQYPVKSGTVRFPAIATPCGDAFHDLFAGIVWDRAPENCPNGMWICTEPFLDKGNVQVHDCLCIGDEQVHKLPLTSRLARLPEPYREQVRMVEKPSDLLDLPHGRWLLRSATETHFDRTAPLGILYDAQAVRPGQYVKPPQPGTEVPEGETVLQDLPEGLRCQIHKQGDRAWLYARERAMDCLDCVPLGREVIASLSCKSAVLDCIVTSDCSPGKLLKVLRSESPHSKVAVEFTAFDCLHLDGEDLHEKPLRERLVALSFVRGGPGFEIASQLDEVKPGCLVRPSESRYPLDWCGEGWCMIPREKPKRDEPKVLEPEPDPLEQSPEEDTRQVEASREWMEVSLTNGATWLDGMLCEAEDLCSLRVIDPSAKGLELSIWQKRLDGDRERARHMSAGCAHEAQRMVRCQVLLGVQRDDMHEAFVLFHAEPERSGRYVWQYSDEDRTWRCWKPKHQDPYLLTCDRDEEVRLAEERGGWVVWNDEAIRLLAESDLKHLLPLNWEPLTDDFCDEPDSDFYATDV